MDKLIKFIIDNTKEVKYSKFLPDNNVINEASKVLNFDFGKQLNLYLKEYGYLSYKFIEFNGINQKQKNDSDLIVQTLNLRKTYPAIKDLVSFTDMGDGDYILIDSKDNVYEFIPSVSDEIKLLNMKLEDFIIQSFEKISKM